jgi:hypothetical protein
MGLGGSDQAELKLPEIFSLVVLRTLNSKRSIGARANS